MSHHVNEMLAERLWEEACEEAEKLFPESEWESPACLAWEEARYAELWENLPPCPYG